MEVNGLGMQLTNNQGALGLSEGMTRPSTNFNFVAGNPVLLGAGANYNFSLNATGVMVHEVGHNNAATNRTSF